MFGIYTSAIISQNQAYYIVHVNAVLHKYYSDTYILYYTTLIHCWFVCVCFLTMSSTTEGSARVETSPSSSCLSAAIFLRIRRMIFPDRVLGNPGTTWNNSDIHGSTIYKVRVVNYYYSSIAAGY